MIKSNASSAAIRFLALAAATIGLRSSCAWATPIAANSATPSAIPWSEIGSRATATYQGDGLVATPTRNGVQLKCVFQRLEGEVTAEGLWLTSTAIEPAGDRFRVTATGVSRNHTTPDALSLAFPTTGTVVMEGQVARFNRPGLVEEYTVSLDGIRQDFILAEPPAVSWRPAFPAEERMAAHEGLLRLELAVNGAVIEPTAAGAQLTLAHSGRQIAYSRLHVTDAVGRELPARFAMNDGGFASTLAILVDDREAVYPIRIDPTFSDVNWVSMGGLFGANGPIYAIVADDSGNLYVGGDFTIVGDVFANRVAKWDGSRWSNLGDGLTDGFLTRVLALAISDFNLYAGGSFLLAGGVPSACVARWDGNHWSAVGQGVDSSVYALATSGNDLYVAGQFTSATNTDGTSVLVNHIAKWDGSQWSPLGQGANDSVRTLLILDNTLYAGGMFGSVTNSDGTDVAAHYIAEWDGVSWHAMGEGTPNPVFSLAVWGGNLCAASYNLVMEWNNTNWQVLGSMSDGVWALAVLDDTLYAGGSMTLAWDYEEQVSIVVNFLAQFDGDHWSAVGSGVWDTYSPNVSALAVSGGKLYLGGHFSTVDGVRVNNLASWDGSSAGKLGNGLDGDVNNILVVESNLYVGGTFQIVGGNPARGVAKWDGSSWSSLGSGIFDGVSALAQSGNELYCAGWSYISSNVMTIYQVAQWDGNHWTLLGQGADSFIYALASDGNKLYAGGIFNTMTNNDGTVVWASHIAKWEGNQWSPVGQGLNDWVSALAFFENELYVGGYFIIATNNDATPITVNRIAKWNENTWLPLGLGVNDAVRVLLPLGDNLYAGGNFTTAIGGDGSDLVLNYVGRWDGQSWNALGNGIDEGGVLALTGAGNTLYAGGVFITDIGVVNCPVAKWDGNQWHSSNLRIQGANNGTGTFRALGLLNDDLYLGGSFQQVNGIISPYLVKGELSHSPAPIPLHWQLAGDTLVLTWDDPSFTLESAPEAVGTYVELPDAVSPYSTTLTGPRRFFRLKSP